MNIKIHLPLKVVRYCRKLTSLFSVGPKDFKDQKDHQESSQRSRHLFAGKKRTRSDTDKICEKNKMT